MHQAERSAEQYDAAVRQKRAEQRYNQYQSQVVQLAHISQFPVYHAYGQISQHKF